jgi:hypothetical protein
MRSFFKVLKEEPDARVALPSAEEIGHYQEMIRKNYSPLRELGA